MTKRTSVVDIAGGYEETIIQHAKDLGQDKLRRKIFDVIYGRGTRPRSIKQIMTAAKIPANKKQQTQNQLNHLAQRHLVATVENNGAVQDGSRILYEKEPTVQARRNEIRKFADNPKKADRTPTKRRPALNVSGIAEVKSTTKRALKKKKKLNVLYLLANPDAQNFLHVDREVRDVQEEVRRSSYRENIHVEYKPAADVKSLIDGLNDLKPQIVHFSGHGHSSGIATDAARKGKSVEELPFSLLAKALKATDAPPQVVVLNACESAGAKKNLIPPAEVLIAMKESISDVAATAFAVRFYAAIASGQSVKAAFDQGAVGIEAVAIGEVKTPQLIHSTNVDPRKIILT